MREGAGVRLRARSSLAASPGLSAPFSLIFRNGESCGVRKPSRPGRKRSEVRVWACAQGVSNAISARHGKTARTAMARLLRPVAGPDPTMRIPQRIHTLDVPVPEPALAFLENVVNGVKTIMVNEPLRGGPCVASRFLPC